MTSEAPERFLVVGVNWIGDAAFFVSPGNGRCVKNDAGGKSR